MLPNSSSASAPDAPAALLFDLDGTLVDSVPDLAAALNATLSEDNRPTLSDHDVSNMVGRGIQVLVDRAYRATGDALEGDDLIATTRRFSAHYNKNPVGRTKAFPGVIETLKVLAERGHPMAVCTNKPQAPAEAVVKALGLAPYFQAIFGAGSVKTLKPHPEMLQTAVQTLKATGPAVMVGDSQNDSEAARAAGMPSVCVTFGYRNCTIEELGADCLIDSFADLPKALDTLLAGK